MIAFCGAENVEGVDYPFVSIHVLEKDFELLGSDENLMKFVKNFEYNIETKDHSIYTKNDTKKYLKVKEIIKDLKFGYLRLLAPKKPMFNIKFLESEKGYFLVGTDY